MTARRQRRWPVPAAVTAIAIALAGCGVSASRAPGSSGSGAAGQAPATAAARVSGADWPTFDAGAARTGVGPGGSGIDARALHRLSVRVVTVNGTVDSSAIELHAVRIDGRRRDAIFVTTTFGRTIAVDPGTGRRLWEFTPRDIGSYEGSAQLTTATPVADPDRRFIYAPSPDGIVHKLAVSDGHEIRAGGWPARVTDDATREKIASALNLSGPSVIVVTGGYIGDAPVYQGHLVLIDRASGRITHVLNTLCSNRTGLIDPPRSCPVSDSAIWGRAGAVVEPRSGRLLIATGNGHAGERAFDGRTNWADSVLELSPAAAILHNWTPVTQQQLSDSDTDIGSTSPAIVAVGGRRLAVQGGKDGHLYLLDLDRLNGGSGPAGPRLGGELQRISSPGGGEVLTAPAVWMHRGRAYLFVADDQGTSAYLVSGGAHPHMSVVWSSARPGTSPVLADGLLYIYDELDGALVVYNPLSGTRLASRGAPTGHWNSPIVVGGRIILPVGSYHVRAGTGQIYIWHLPGR